MLSQGYPLTDSEEPNSLPLPNPKARNKNMYNCPDRLCWLLTASCTDERACLQEHQPESFKGLLTGNYEPKKNVLKFWLIQLATLPLLRRWSGQ